MRDLKEMDKNFALETNIVREGMRFYDVSEAPFRIHGVFKANGKFRRMPEDAANRVNELIHDASEHTAGGRVRFITDSPYVILKTVGQSGKMDHFAFTGSVGFDMFGEWDGDVRYMGTFRPPVEVTNGYEAVIDIPEKKERLITINFPLYSFVEELYLGLQEGCTIKEAPDYTIKKPVVYYGSSITQGGCASKPGSSYQSILSREFDCDYINLGFSGKALAEDAMVDHIKGLEMSVFVMDYDHNAPSLDHLEATHEKMFLAIREAQPKLPILILPRPKYYLTAEDQKRREIIERTYNNAKARGDKNVYFIENHKLMELVKDNGTVDGCHPTDSGFFCMARAIAEVFREIFVE